MNFLTKTWARLVSAFGTDDPSTPPKTLVERLTLKPGDVLVVKFNTNILGRHMAETCDHLLEHLPKGVDVVAVGPEADLCVVTSFRGDPVPDDLAAKVKAIDETFEARVRNAIARNPGLLRQLTRRSGKPGNPVAAMRAVGGQP